MGTRHLIAVVLNNEYKVASYGQWDGYPSGQGLDILRFLRENNLDRFAEKVAKCRWITEEEINEVKGKNIIPEKYAHLSRDTGSKILSRILASEGLALQDSSSFAADGLFCEWAYVIDLDKQTFEVYQGFKETPVPEGQRFFSMNPDPENFVPDYEGQTLYYPVQLVKEYSMNNLHPLFLPSDEDFIADCERRDEEEA